MLLWIGCSIKGLLIKIKKTKTLLETGYNWKLVKQLKSKYLVSIWGCVMAHPHYSAPGMGVNLAVKVRCGLGSGNH